MKQQRQSKAFIQVYKTKGRFQRESTKGITADGSYTWGNEVAQSSTSRRLRRLGT